MLDWPEESWEQFGISDGGRPQERGWRAFGLDAYHRIEVLAFGCGWDVEYPRDRWRLRNLGVDGETATISFAGIPQPWLTDLAKRCARWRLASGTGPSSVALGVRALARFAVFLASPPAGVDPLAQIDRAVIERYLADLGAEFGGRKSHGEHIGALSSFVRAVRQHGWASTLPATAAFFPDDYPRRGKKLPRALAGHVIAQVEQPGNLDRWDNPAYRLITLILMRCGLRVSDAAKLPFDCIACDADGAPYLRCCNRKMKREALVPIDDELRQQLLCQQQAVLQRWPAGAPVLFPRVTGNLRGDQPIKSSVYRRALYRWLEDCDVRDVLIVCLETSAAVHLGQVRGDLPVGQLFRRQGNDHLIDSGEPALPLATIFGSKLESRSRGTAISTGPVSLITVLTRWPLRELPPSRPAGSCLP